MYWQTWAEPDQSSPKEALGTLVDLNRVLRHRLAVLEVVPAAMKRYTIGVPYPYKFEIELLV